MTKFYFYKTALYFFLILLFLANSVRADYPATSIGVIDINLILTESKAAVDAAKQIENIAKEIEEEIKNEDQNMLNLQNELIESQAIVAPDVFEEKRLDYEKKLQNYNETRQQKLVSIDNLIAKSRNSVLDALKPILEDISNEKEITILLEKGTVLLNAEGMDITEEVLKILNKELPTIEVEID